MPGGQLSVIAHTSSNGHHLDGEWLMQKPSLDVYSADTTVVPRTIPSLLGAKLSPSPDLGSYHRLYHFGRRLTGEADTAVPLCRYDL
jgi:hypothetical protein